MRLGLGRWLFGREEAEDSLDMLEGQRKSLKLRIRDKRLREQSEHYEGLLKIAERRIKMMEKALGEIEELEGAGYEIRKEEIPKGVSYADALASWAGGYVGGKWGKKIGALVQGAIIENKGEIDALAAGYIRQFSVDLLGKVNPDAKVSEVVKELKGLKE